ncbi:MAG: tryptophan 2,3-dioxygenase, partial [Allosphingosinicella sp.]
WFKQILHELDRIEADFSKNPVDDRVLGRIVHGLSRMHEILKLLVHQLDVIETMTPLDFLDFRDLLYPASGFQSAQFREFEYRLGLKDGGHLKFQEEGSCPYAALLEALHQPSLWDEANAAAARAGLDLPADVLERDWSLPYRPSEAVEAAWARVYREPERHWALYQLAEKLVDIDDSLAGWRHKHVVTVERIIGLKRGTGGTAGVAYLQSTLGKRAFPELWSLRTLV